MITTEDMKMELRDIKRRNQNEMKEDLERVFDLLITKDQELDDRNLAILSNFKDKIEEFLVIQRYEKLERLFEGRD
jgi:hypothetical protein